MRRLWIGFTFLLVSTTVGATPFDRGEALYRVDPFGPGLQPESRNESVLEREVVASWHAAIVDATNIINTPTVSVDGLQAGPTPAITSIVQPGPRTTTEHVGWLDIANISITQFGNPERAGIARCEPSGGCNALTSFRRSWTLSTALDGATLQRLFAQDGIVSGRRVVQADDGQWHIWTPHDIPSGNLVVPLPAALVLLLSALAGLSAFPRRRWLRR